MKNIYERLDPLIKESIKLDLDKYPISTGALIESLQKSIFWSELKMDDVQRVINHSHISLYEISMKDVMWGDKFLIDEEN